MASDTTYSASEFLEKLTTNSLAPQIEVRGFARKTDAPSAISFSLGTSCKEWVEVPTEAIAEVVHHGQRRCHDHSHDYVTLRFTESSDRKTVALAALLSAATHIDREPSMARVQAPSPFGQPIMPDSRYQHMRPPVEVERSGRIKSYDCLYNDYYCGRFWPCACIDHETGKAYCCDCCLA
jgi:hypothetical protein